MKVVAWVVGALGDLGRATFASSGGIDRAGCVWWDGSGKTLFPGFEFRSYLPRLVLLGQPGVGCQPPWLARAGRYCEGSGTSHLTLGLTPT